MNNRSSVSDFIEDLTDAVADVLYKKSFKEIVTYDEVVRYVLEAKKQNPYIVSYLASVKKNYDPQNENDKFIVIIGLLDGMNKPISLNGKDAESLIIHTKTIDRKFIDILNGDETKIIKL